MRPSRTSLVALLCVALLLPSGAVGAQQRKAKQRFAAAVAPVRLIPTSSQAIAISGSHAFFGTVELGAFGDGIALINDIDLERYLLGLNEVPVGWPMEALKAQAVAARTYALWTLDRPRAGTAAVYGFDICATVQCQVFSGADVVNLVDGERWVEAVRATAGEVVLYQNEPILARYHSTSGGATLDNPQAFPEEGSYPYLQGVSSTTEERAPLYRWRTSFTLSEMQLILERSGIWNAAFKRLLDVRLRPSNSGLHYPDVLFIGKKGRTRRTAEQWREVLRDYAPALFPGRYPSAAPTTSGVLPETFPSNRLERIVVRRGSVEIVGRGWGHGVGMSQWGAEGLARRGFGYIDILNHYYTGVSVSSFRTPGKIRVGTATGLGSVVATGAFRIVDARGRTLAPDAIGTWVFRFGGAGVIGIEPPAGYGLPLRLGIVKAPRRVEPGAKATFQITLSRPAKVRVVTTPGGRPTEPVVRSAGKGKVAWRAPTRPGRYVVRVQALARSVKRRSEPLRIVVPAPPEQEATAPNASAEASPTLAATAVEEDDDIGMLGLIALIFLIAVAVATGVLAAKIDRWAKQPPQR
jgi:stage II sporulation protein D